MVSIAKMAVYVVPNLYNHIISGGQQGDVPPLDESPLFLPSIMRDLLC